MGHLIMGNKQLFIVAIDLMRNFLCNATTDLIMGSLLQNIVSDLIMEN